MSLSKICRLAIVVPCYNEEAVLPETINRFSKILKNLYEKKLINNDSYILFVDDGSIDRTWQIIKNTSKKTTFVKGLKLSKNQGHQNALLAGMNEVVNKCDCMISIDADLQQDPNAMEDMLKKYQRGYEVVLGIRDNRDTDTHFKKFTAQCYYKVMKLMGVDIETNHADYRLLSNRALQSFLSFKEKNIFIRGMIKLIGFKSTKVIFKNSDRYAGTSKYTLKKMLQFGWNGITSFSLIPLKIITVIGFIIFFISLSLSLYVFYSLFISQTAVPGWASTVLPIYFLGGIELLALGIIGEYIGKIYSEVKNRPLYFIEERTN
jgi:glycosyltransferase involved in cell wall biosynthesis